MKNIIKYAILYALLVITPSIITCPHDESSIVTISTVDHHKNFLNNNQGPCVVFYHMVNCMYCEKMKPMFTKLANLFGHITFYMVNGPDLQAEQDVKEIMGQNIEGYPTIITLNHGQVVGKQDGAASQNVIIQMLSNVDPATTRMKNAAQSRLKLRKNLQG